MAYAMMVCLSLGAEVVGERKKKGECVRRRPWPGLCRLIDLPVSRFGWTAAALQISPSDTFPAHEFSRIALWVDSNSPRRDGAFGEPLELTPRYPLNAVSCGSRVNASRGIHGIGYHRLPTQLLTGLSSHRLCAVFIHLCHPPAGIIDPDRSDRRVSNLTGRVPASAGPQTWVSLLSCLTCS